MTTLEVLFAILWVISLILFVIALATPNARARDWAFGFLLAAVLVLGLGGRVIH